MVIGNLDEDGYLAASEEELAAALSQFGSWSSDNGRGTDTAENGVPGNGVQGTARLGMRRREHCTEDAAAIELVRARH